MKYRLIFILFFLIACKHHAAYKNLAIIGDPTSIKDTEPESQQIEDAMLGVDTATNYEYQTDDFLLVKQYPVIKDTALFIKALKSNCHLYYEFSKIETINYFKKIKLYGSDKDFYLIEFDYHGGEGAMFPWKNQLVFNKAGKLVKVFDALRIDVVKIFPNQNPFLFMLLSTEKGNGCHEVQRIRKDTIEQIYDGFEDLRPSTYGCGYFNWINEPNELNHKFIDLNNDGFNDLEFYGKVRYSKIDLGFNDHIIPVKFVFLYHPQTGHFVEQKNYSKIYSFIYGEDE